MSPNLNTWSAQTLHRSGLILGSLSLCAFIGLGAWFWQANAAQERATEVQTARLAVIELSGKNLAGKLDEQRAQFEACKDAKPGTPGCDNPVTPPAKEVAPQIVTGPIGPQGFQGLQGLQGPKGDTGLTGINGLAGTDGAGTNGTNGADGTTGPAGADGTSGTNGTDGATGPAGVQGDPGPAGVDGTNGTDGAPGQSAYPFTFTFTTTTGLAYICTLPAAGEPGTCTEAPTATPTTGG